MSAPTPRIPTQKECLAAAVIFDRLVELAVVDDTSLATPLRAGADMARAVNWQRDRIAEIEAERDQLRAEVERLNGALATIEARLRNGTKHILAVIRDSGSRQAHWEWREAIYASAIHAQVSISGNNINSAASESAALGGGVADETRNPR